MQIIYENNNQILFQDHTKVKRDIYRLKIYFLLLLIKWYKLIKNIFQKFLYERIKWYFFSFFN